MTYAQVKSHQYKMGKLLPETKNQSIHEAEFERQIRLHGLIGWVDEYKFHPTRKWRFDFAFVMNGVAVEVEGMVYDGRGRHQTTKGYTNDCEKYNAAVELGWKVYRFVPQMIATGEAIEQLKRGLHRG